MGTITVLLIALRVTVNPVAIAVPLLIMAATLTLAPRVVAVAVVPALLPAVVPSLEVLLVVAPRVALVVALGLVAAPLVVKVRGDYMPRLNESRK